MARARTPPPRDVLRAVLRQAERGWPTGLTVLGGDSLYHLDRAQRAILGSLDALDLAATGATVFAQPRAEIAEVVAAARLRSMFAPRQVVLVRDGGTLQGDERLLGAYAAAPPPASHLVVRVAAFDLRRKLHKTLSEVGQRFVFSIPRDVPGAGDDEAGALARERGLRIDAEALRLLVTLGGGDLARVERELEKLEAWVEPPGAPVDAQAVLQIAAGSELLSGWEAAAAVTRRDRAAALVALRRLVGSGEPPLRILGGLASRGRALLQGKALAEAGTEPRRIVETLRAWFYQQDLLLGLRRYEREELRAFPAHLLGADRTLKSRSLGPTAVLEQLAERLLGGSDDPAS